MKRLVIVSSLVLFFSGIIPLDQAHAALDNNLCDTGELCVWENDRMTGCFSSQMAVTTSSSPRIHSDWYDNISSFGAAGNHTFSEKDKCAVRKRNQG